MPETYFRPRYANATAGGIKRLSSQVTGSQQTASLCEVSGVVVESPYPGAGRTLLAAHPDGAPSTYRIETIQKALRSLSQSLRSL